MADTLLLCEGEMFSSNEARKVGILQLRILTSAVQGSLTESPDLMTKVLGEMLGDTDHAVCDRHAWSVPSADLVRSHSNKKWSQSSRAVGINQLWIKNYFGKERICPDHIQVFFKQYSIRTIYIEFAFH